MKKLFITVFALVAIASFGGIVASAHAQTATLTPAQAAALQQELSSLEAQLTQLQAQAAAQGAQTAQPATVSSPAASGAPLTMNGMVLTTQDVASLTNALSLLASALTNINAEISANPSLVSGHEAAVASAFQSIGLSLTAISGEVAQATIVPGAPVAAAPAAASAQAATSQANAAAPAATAPSTAATQPTPTTQPSAEGSLPSAPAANTTPQIAQVGSAFSLAHLNWPLTVVIVLVVAAIALWIFWPGEDKTAKVVAAAKSPVAPSPVAKQMPMMAHAGKPAQQQQPQQQRPQNQTPLATAVAAPSEKPGINASGREAQSAPQQQRKPA